MQATVDMCQWVYSEGLFINDLMVLGEGGGQCIKCSRSLVIRWRFCLKLIIVYLWTTPRTGGVLPLLKVHREASESFFFIFKVESSKADIIKCNYDDLNWNGLQLKKTNTPVKKFSDENLFLIKFFVAVFLFCER